MASSSGPVGDEGDVPMSSSSFWSSSAGGIGVPSTATWHSLQTVLVPAGGEEPATAVTEQPEFSLGGPPAAVTEPASYCGPYGQRQSCSEAPCASVVLGQLETQDPPWSRSWPTGDGCLQGDTGQTFGQTTETVSSTGRGVGARRDLGGSAASASTFSLSPVVGPDPPESFSIAREPEQGRHGVSSSASETILEALSALSAGEGAAFQSLSEQVHPPADPPSFFAQAPLQPSEALGVRPEWGTDAPMVMQPPSPFLSPPGGAPHQFSFATHPPRAARERHRLESRAPRTRLQPFQIGLPSRQFPDAFTRATSQAAPQLSLVLPPGPQSDSSGVGKRRSQGGVSEVGKAQSA